MIWEYIIKELVDFFSKDVRVEVIYELINEKCWGFYCFVKRRKGFLGRWNSIYKGKKNVKGVGWLMKSEMLIFGFWFYL